jgi:hypothetical protein
LDRVSVIPPLLSKYGNVFPYKIPHAVLNKCPMARMYQECGWLIRAGPLATGGDRQNKIKEGVPERVTYLRFKHISLARPGNNRCPVNF